MSQLPPPNQLGAPRRFDRWRTGQEDALIQGWGSTTRAVVYDLPTGVGKSIVGNVHNTAHGASYVYMTADLGLQDQVLKEFSSIGLVDVRGMANYECLELKGRRYSKCDKGPCLDGGECAYRFNGCSYFDQARYWVTQPRRLTNYAWWLARARNEDSVGKIDALVMDEAHDAAEMVASAMRLTFQHDEVNLPHVLPTEMKGWRAWADGELPRARQEFGNCFAGTEAHRSMKDLVRRLEIMAITEGEWVSELQMEGQRAVIEPVWAGPYCERLLYRGVEKLIFMSATMSKSDMKYLGMNEPDYTWISALCPFPAKQRPLIYIPTVAVSLYKNTEWELQRLVDRVDEVLDAERGNKGLIHAVSYKLARLIYHSSRHTKRMLMPVGKDTRATVAKFKAMKGDPVLISPAIDTGYDFPYEAARFQIIPKLPFPPIQGSAILTRRKEEDKAYPNHLTVKRVTQMYGRINRAEDDEGRTYLLDSNWGNWFWPANKKAFPAWLREAVRVETKVPGLTPAKES